MDKPTRWQIELCLLQMMQEEIYKEKIEEVIGLLSPDTYKPIITVFDCLYPIRILYPDIYDHISYWWYDCSCMEWGGLVTCEKRWELRIQGRSLESIKKYLLRDELIVE